ncbi:hypothetical protein GGS24DRAFT_516170 [Hypoxylon argillaceum]|nr:hypothetical protein GGS24DRAFT_516170 [Hypoxylon argillaceum]
MLSSDAIIRFSSQLANPSNVVTVLMVIGGDVVQKALAQSTGCLYTPVCFSFGWVTYAFVVLVSMMGDQRLLPPPDSTVKVFNLGSGYHRDNRNWVVGRIFRDMELYMARKEPILSGAIRISIWKARENPNRYTMHSYSKIHILGLVVTAIQLAVASIPLVLYGDFGILLLTATGTLMTIVMGSLPQWRAEKLPNRQHSNKLVALTSGNGSRDIIVIMGGGRCLDLEDLSAQETPRNGRVWEKFAQEDPGLFPLGFWFTFGICVVQLFAWLGILVSSAALAENTWFLILVGVIGMGQNAYLANVERNPAHYNLPLDHIKTITREKVMYGLMDLEANHGCGRPLVAEFFPGSLRQEEDEWWNGDRKAYDEMRSHSKSSRGAPRSSIERLN